MTNRFSELVESLGSGWNRFWFTPDDPIGLHCIRVFAGLLFLFWLVPMAGHVDALFGFQGWFGSPNALSAFLAPLSQRNARVTGLRGVRCFGATGIALSSMPGSESRPVSRITSRRSFAK